MSTDIRIEELWQKVCELERQNSSWKSKDLLKTIITIRPDHASARVTLARIYMTDGDIESALLQANFAYQLNPEIPQLAKLLADLYFMSGLYDRALPLYQVAIRAGDKDRITAERLVTCKNIVASEAAEEKEQ